MKNLARVSVAETMKKILGLGLIAQALLVGGLYASDGVRPLAAIGLQSLPFEQNVSSTASAEVTFTDATAESGIVQNNSSWGVAWADYDNDGNVDALTVGHLLHPNVSIVQLWHNNGDGTFTDVTFHAGLKHLDGDCHGAVWADFDNDGYLDLFISKGTIKELRANYDDLWHNNGDGTFTNIANTSHVTGQALCDDTVTLSKRDNRGAYAIDYDGDSNLDIFVTSFYQGDLCRDANLLFRNRGALRFSDVGVKAGVDRPLMENRTAAWADFDGDGLIDFFVTRPSTLYRNRGDGTFEDVTATAGIISSDDAQAAAWGDYDNDGNQDLYVTMGAEDGPPAESILFRNNGDGTFTDVTSQSGTTNLSSGLGVTWGDYDNDGFLDLYVVNSTYKQANRLFHNNGDGTFSDRAAQAGVNAKSDEGKGSDASFADYNNDGFLDLFVCNGAQVTYGPYMCFRNNGNSNGWLKVELVGQQSNRSAIGAKIFLTTGAITQMREYTGQHYMSQNHIPVHFGVGAATKVDSLVIKWPSGITQELDDVVINQTIPVREQ